VLWHVGLTLAVVWLLVRDRPFVDYRLVALGSVLPDLVDKPLQLFVFRDGLTSGRTYGHTLIVHLTVLLAIVLYVKATSPLRYAFVPIAAVMHLVEDGVFSSPRVLLWPALGVTFPPKFARTMVGADALADPTFIRQEIIGAVLLVLFLVARRISRRSQAQATSVADRR
jgi:hypothetical protein